MIHKKLTPKSKLPKIINIGDIFPFSSSMDGKEVKSMLRERGFNCESINSEETKTIKAFGLYKITEEI